MYQPHLYEQWNIPYFLQIILDKSQPARQELKWLTQKRFALKRKWKVNLYSIISVQFSSVAQSCPTLCDPINCSTPGLPVQWNLKICKYTHIYVYSCRFKGIHFPSLIFSFLQWKKQISKCTECIHNTGPDYLLRWSGIRLSKQHKNVLLEKSFLFLFFNLFILIGG